MAGSTGKDIKILVPEKAVKGYNENKDGGFSIAREQYSYSVHNFKR
jgi:hypothetical protein